MKNPAQNLPRKSLFVTGKPSLWESLGRAIEHKKQHVLCAPIKQQRLQPPTLTASPDPPHPRQVVLGGSPTSNLVHPSAIKGTGAIRFVKRSSQASAIFFFANLSASFSPAFVFCLKYGRIPLCSSSFQTHPETGKFVLDSTSS